ncbi:aldehyde dehydrogenase [Mesorhizobium sp. M3A.F.Ca.ET.201.01.1.1]|uniref:aldehyde dehydrogenase n=1 Tax=Mesorhizobium sp. M3A.F.Ca.ET.201.01.1.1 TaxID=2563946 RepID=UPI001093CAE6|nr:aldehyde dehydrogenase [Mesorhizobium sp. M3A.F.Ca.ET.201.01.1.1]TGS71712.1 aldehyde dehydrogenase [Mesorhizobium sp. M3A.F.Ca.ET.201.01.1.1]
MTSSAVSKRAAAQGSDKSVVTAALAAVDAAHAAFPEWAELGPAERRRRLGIAAELLAGKGDEFTALMAEEIGASAAWAQFNVRLAAGMMREAAAMTSQINGEIIPSDRPGSFAMAIRQPVGVCLGIAPWNAPVILATRALAMPLACGNTVVLKASETCPKTHALLAELMDQAGLGKDVVKVVANEEEDAADVVKALVEHPAVRRVNFTGSTRVGRIVGELAGRALKPVLLELGGKSPLIVLADADIDEAVNAAAFGAFMYQGQICMSTERVVIDERVADRFVEKLRAKVATLPVGDPSLGSVIGPVISDRSAERFLALVADARAKGADVSGGERLKPRLFKPAVADRVTSEMALFAEESFGPVVTVVRVKSEDDLAGVANDTSYGLAGAIFTRDITKALRIARKVQTGSFHINGPTVHDEAQMPFGGMKDSGFGRFGGKAAIHEFTDLRWVTIATEPVHYPF